MWIRLARELSGRTTRNSALILFVLGAILLSAILGYTLLKLYIPDTFAIIKNGFIVLNLGFAVLGAIYLFRGRAGKFLRQSDIRNIAFGLILVMLLQNVLLLLYTGNLYVALGFILAFFMGGSFLPLYIRYISDLSVLHTQPEDRVSLDALFRQYEISPREKEIIREICRGLSNQQIADKLFITLQTVKDHTSRIYDKTNCKSRAQLIALVNEKAV
jgi:DNA-binding CsgD family transcriptional regulator